jgi:acyl carrier protein
MGEDEIKQELLRLLKTIAPDTEPEKLKPDDKIRQTLGIDSFDYLQFIIGFDEHFGVKTPEEDYGKIETLRSLVPYIASRVKEKKAVS